MFKRLLPLIVFIVFGNNMRAIKDTHPSSYPFIAGDTLRAFAQFRLDDIQSFDPLCVRTGDTISVQSDKLNEFFNLYHPKIQFPYVLITSNLGADADDPMPGKFWRFVEDNNLAAWFTQNIDVAYHQKISALPIGLANQCWSHGKIETFAYYIKNFQNRPRMRLLYMNFSTSTCPEERLLVWRLFAGKPFCDVQLNRELPAYLDDLLQHKFTLSPRGHGLDCHRTWEALLMGSIPIVKSSTLDVLYKDLPVLIVKDWNNITEEFLERKYQEMISKTYDMRKIYAEYWFDQIRKMQQDIRAKQ